MAETPVHPAGQALTKRSKVGSIRVRIVTVAVAALTLVLVGSPPALAAASPGQTAGLPNCNLNGAVAPCFEIIWVDGVQVKMNFVKFNPKPSNVPTHGFYVVAPQTSTPQGSVPFLHDHVIGDVQSHDGARYHAFFVLCSAQGIASGGCVPTMTSIPGLGTIPLAKTVNGHSLTSGVPIESPADSGLLTLFDTGGVFIATVTSRQGDR